MGTSWVAACLGVGLALASTAVEARGVKVGEPAPPARITLFDGRRIELASLRGKVVVLNFWATWCGPCRQELPLLDAAHAQKNAAGLEVFAATIEDDVPPFKLKPLQEVLSMPLARRISGPYGDFARAVPVNVVIDRAGVVRYAKAGAFTPETINALLLPLLREAAPPPPEPATVSAR